MSDVVPCRSVVYTVIVGGYDDPMPLVARQSGVDHILVTDRTFDHCAWTQRLLPPEVAQMAPVDASRWCKFHSHLLFPDHDLSVYVDGNLAIIGSLAGLMSEFAASGASMGLFAHGVRKTVAAEIETCRKMGKFSARDMQVLAGQVQRYRASGILDQDALTDNGVIFRNHRAADLPGAMASWWAEFLTGVKRDQISLPWVRKTTRIDCLVWPWNYRRDKGRFAGPFGHFGRKPMRRMKRLRYRAWVWRRIVTQLWLWRTRHIRRRLKALRG